jgi:hypothetical protein
MTTKYDNVTKMRGQVAGSRNMFRRCDCCTERAIGINYYGLVACAAHWDINPVAESFDYDE